MVETCCCSTSQIYSVGFRPGEFCGQGTLNSASCSQTISGQFVPRDRVNYPVDRCHQLIGNICNHEYKWSAMLCQESCVKIPSTGMPRPRLSQQNTALSHTHSTSFFFLQCVLVPSDTQGNSAHVPACPHDAKRNGTHFTQANTFHWSKAQSR